MYTGIKHLHSITAYLTLVFLVIAVLYAFYCWIGKKKFLKTSRIIMLLALIGTHVQLLFGLIIYFVSPLGFSNFSGESMKNAASRFYIVEHPMMMIVAIGLITFGYSTAKRLPEDSKKFRRIAIFYTVGLIAILLRIPWNVWL